MELDVIGKICICSITILLIAYLLYQPVNVHIYTHTSSYHPEILYLGRHNHLEDGGYPSNPADPKSQDIYAIVEDNYGKNLTGTLNYKIQSNKSLFKTGVIHMKLLYGIPSNGTWYANITKVNASMPYTVTYNAIFNDTLNYSVNQAGPFYDNLRYNDNENDENFMGGHGYDVADRYILVDDTPFNKKLHNICTCAGHKETFTAIVSDKGRNITKVIFSYKFIRNGSWVQENETKMNSVHTSTNYLKYIYADGKYLATIPVPNLSNLSMKFQSILYDNSSKPINSTVQNLSIKRFSSTNAKNTISITTYISDVNISNQIAAMQIKLEGPLIDSRDLNIPLSTRDNNIGNAENVNLQILDIINNNTFKQNNM